MKLNDKQRKALRSLELTWWPQQMGEGEEDGADKPVCRLVKTGTKTIPAREEPIYKLVCDNGENDGEH